MISGTYRDLNQIEIIRLIKNLRPKIESSKPQNRFLILFRFKTSRSLL
jgi:hypothetical protein